MPRWRHTATGARVVITTVELVVHKKVAAPDPVAMVTGTSPRRARVIR